MQITIKEIQTPILPDESRQIKGRTSYKIISTDTKTFFCKPENRPSDLNIGMKIEIDVWVDNYNNNHINNFTVVNQDNVPQTPVPMPKPQPIAPQPPQNSYQEPLDTGAGGNDIVELKGRDWSIILQAMCNRFTTWNPDQKLQWFLMNYSRGSEGAFKHLQQIEDLNNTAISGNTPDDEINF
jgi:hypothetical protein